MPTKAKRSKIYGNCMMLSPDGDPMFRCHESRIKWYVSRDLAEVIQDDPTVARLLIEPKGPGQMDDPYHLQDRVNKCVVCGALDELNRHHIVPYSYRKHLVDKFPAYKHDIHDIVPICISCHDSYEKTYAILLKQKLADDVGAPLNGDGFIRRGNRHLASMASAIIQYEDRIPHEKQIEILEKVEAELGKIPGYKELHDLASSYVCKKSSDYKTHGEIVSDTITTNDEFFEFIRLWRHDFVSNMKPEFMPEHWSLDRPLRERKIDLDKYGGSDA